MLEEEHLDNYVFMIKKQKEKQLVMKFLLILG